MREKHRAWGVPLAAIGLIAAVWASLQLSRSAESADDALPLPALPAATDLPGFRLDAWFLPDDDLLGFVEVPGGPFLMGSDPDVDPLAFDIERWSSSAPQGVVDLPTFYIARYEVTVAQYATFAADARYHAVGAALKELSDHPMGGVAWTDALAYARWLEAKLRGWQATPPTLARLLGEGWRVTLPTEAQWEKAARGTDGRIYPWGNEPRRDRANFGSPAPTAVSTFDCPECPYGLADMSGNVWEWTRSAYQPYPYDPATARVDLQADALWVMRGGSYADTERNIRAAARGGADPGARRPFLGFRLVISGP